MVDRNGFKNKVLPTPKGEGASGLKGEAMLVRALGLILILAVAAGCVPVAVGTVSAVWYGLLGRDGCEVTRNKPDFEEKLKDPKYKEYFETMCGKLDQPKP